MTQFSGKVTQIVVEDGARTASVITDPPDAFKVATGNDSAFEGMIDVLSLARLLGVFGVQVTIDYSSVSKEIDKITA